MPFYTDQLERRIELEHIPKRIVSLVPSQTELLYDLGLSEEVVGITKFCVHPQKWYETKTKVGGTKQVRLSKIKELRPDLIIANKEENVQEQIEELANHFSVWISDVTTLNEAYKMIPCIGEITGKYNKAKAMVRSIQHNFAQLQNLCSKPRTCYLIWRKPYMTVGGDTFINDMMQYAQLQNIFSDKKRYPQITIEQLQAAQCQLLLLPSEPFPFTQKHIDELQTLLPTTKMILVDGEMFSWYGSRLLKAPLYFQQLQNEILSLSHAAGNR